MKIKAEKKYIAANGNIVEIVKEDYNEIYPCWCNTNKSYTKNGNRYTSKISEDDLICEIVPSIYVLCISGIINLKELIKQHIEYYTK